MDMKFGILEWEAEYPAKEVNFLDLTIRIEKDGILTFKTFVKPQNMFLYIPAHSAHPKGVLKSLIFGGLYTYAIQNSMRADFIAMTKALFEHLINWGYTNEMLSPIFKEAATMIDRKQIGAASTDYSYKKLTNQRTIEYSSIGNTTQKTSEKWLSKTPMKKHLCQFLWNPVFK
jgi:hypothetical protein